jgi:predicted metal-binding membrane protein
VIAPAVGSPRRLWSSAPYLVIAAAWGVAFALALTGVSHTLGHGEVAELHRSLLLSVALFLVGWQLMIAAMMLPSSLPMLNHYAGVAERQGLPARSTWQFVGGYALVWTSFGVLALFGDMALHRLIDAWSWLDTHDQFVLAGVLAVAGLVQFTSLKDRCLRQCRRPYAFLMRKRLQGVTNPVRLGVAHGIFCVGCCWGLMLLMFAVGVANLAWMAGLTAVMVYEKTAPGGERLVRAVGVLVLAVAVLVAADPTWLPLALAGGH